MLLKAALNGARPPGAHLALPITPEELAAAAASSVAAGAGALHLHVRDAWGRESLAAADVARALTAVRAACPGVPVGISTGAWIEPDLERRLALIAAWSVRPDFASVNLPEPGALAVARALLAGGVALEAGLASAADAELLVASGLAHRCLRVLIEPVERDLAAARATVAAIVRALDGGHVEPARLLHGEDATAWPLLRDAVALSYDTRVGLEDVLLLPDGAPAPDNAALVLAARRIMAGDRH